MLESMLSEEKTLYANGRITAFRLAETSSLMGQKQQSMAYLRAAQARHELALSALLVDPFFRVLRDDPSYRELLSQVGLSRLTAS